MTRLSKSDAPDAEAARHRCRLCGGDYLEGYEHHHATEPDSGYDPMPWKPATREGLIAVIRHEYLAELPSRIHVQYVPSHAEPIGVSQYSAEAAGWVSGDATETVLDTGALGSPSWAPPFHRRIGSYRFLIGEMVQADGELHDAPWTRNLNGVRRWCSGKHRTWYEHHGEPLCWTLARLAVEGGYGIGQAAKLVQLSPETVDRLLFGFERQDGKHQNGALEQWWAWTANDLNGLTLHRVRKPAA